MRAISVALVLLVWMHGVAADRVLSPDAFAGEYLVALQGALPGAEVKYLGDMELKVTRPDGADYLLFLNNAYATYLQAPDEKSAIIAGYVASTVETHGDSNHRIDPARIVPVVKDRAWLVEAQRVVRETGGEESPPNAYEVLNDELIVLYAEDTPTNIRYLTRGDLTELNLQDASLKGRSVQNLMALLPPIELYGGDGVYMIAAGGTYEASLLLADSIWDSGQIEVRGDYVVAIPARDVLLITGSDDPDNIAKLRGMVAAVIADTPYRLTDVLFVYRNGVFVRYDP